MREITTFEIAEIFQNAFGRVATPVKAIKGFENTGIFPVNPDHFTLEDFAAAEGFIKDREKEKSQEDAANQGIEEQNIEKDNKEQGEEANVHEHERSFADLIPLPGCSQDNTSSKKCKKNNNKKQHSEIFTSTPMKIILENKQTKKKEKLRKKTNKGTKCKVF
jgi:hypothetical protein